MRRLWSRPGGRASRGGALLYGKAAKPARVRSSLVASKEICPRGVHVKRFRAAFAFKR
jgi:hypothetical protein